MAEYYRRDQADGITPPNLLKDVTFAEHIVRARGKQDRFTSVSLDIAKIKDFGEATYALIQDKLLADTHDFIAHDDLISDLQNTARSGEKAERLRALQAYRYAKLRREGLVKWLFDISRIEKKNMYVWTKNKVDVYFKRA